ncbi:hypothetical protein [Quatrionicoccus australiensis]|uniref:hypothetical protein n=1 Tax=Quatrionicoccus australiensis TaxID=138118 RepID=UPI001CF95AD3|nr:hypothetical protein [Quatrionicoccus australiensis]MCB4359378.1 hypothetical protein [Quatrionicoccus australiensis]
MTTNTLIAYFLQGLMLGWLLQQPFKNRWAWPFGLLLAALPLAGMPLAGHLRGFFGDPSVTSIQLLALAMLGRAPKPLTQDWRAPLLIGLGGVLFYTLALGGAIKLGMTDPYRLGYQPGILLGVLATLALFLWWRGQALWLWLLSIDLLAFAQEFELSRNLWDSLLDPQLVFVCLILAYRNRRCPAKANYAPADSTST